MNQITRYTVICLCFAPLSACKFLESSADSVRENSVPEAVEIDHSKVSMADKTVDTPKSELPREVIETKTTEGIHEVKD